MILKSFKKGGLVQGSIPADSLCWIQPRTTYISHEQYESFKSCQMLRLLNSGNGLVIYGGYKGLERVL